MVDDRSLRPLAFPLAIDPPRLTLVTAPAELFAATDEAVLIALKLESDLVDAAKVNMCLAAARQHFENVTGLAILQQTWCVRFDRTPAKREIELPRAPLMAVGTPTAVVVNSVKYIPESGVEATLSSASYTAPRAGQRRCFTPLRLAPSADWPDLGDYPGALSIEFNAGFGATIADVPKDIQAAVLFLAAYWYENQLPVNVGNIVNEMPLHLNALIESHRVAFIG